MRTKNGIHKQGLFLFALSLLLAAQTFGGATFAGETKSGCRKLIHQNIGYILCSFDARKDDIRLFHSGADGQPYRQFQTLAKALKGQGKTLSFAMNAGMYHADRAPVGYYVEQGKQMVPLNMRSGRGNFFLKPNGVFVLEGQKAGVWESKQFQARKSRLPVTYATQSGPMLVIDGLLHKALSPTSTSKYRRNGVGVMKDQRTVHFLISDMPVNFHSFASVFKDRLKVANALYLDGFVSRIYAPSLGITNESRDFGPIVGVVRSGK